MPAKVEGQQSPVNHHFLQSCFLGIHSPDSIIGVDLQSSVSPQHEAAPDMSCLAVFLRVLKLLRDAFISKREKRIHTHKYIGLFLNVGSSRYLLIENSMDIID